MQNTEYMNIKLLCVGKTNFDFVNKGNDIYIARLQRMVNFEVIYVADIKNAKKMSVSEIKRKESEALMKHIKVDDRLCLLDEKGKTYSSLEFANFINKNSLESVKQLVFVVGGAYGFDKTMYERANYKISLSAMTFSHQIIRVIFLEQLYRAYTIINGTPYHNQ